MNRIHRMLAALVFATLALPSAASAFTLDAFTDALPPNACLPASGQTVVFSGTYCDGAACPPGSWVTCSGHDAVQLGLPGVHAGTRREVETWGFPKEGWASAWIDAATQRFHGVCATPDEVGAVLSHGTPYVSTPEPGALDLDLPALGVTSLRFVVDGNMTPEQPLLVATELLTDGPDSPRPSAYNLQVLTQPGIVDIPLAAFTFRMGNNLDDVDDIQILFSNCTNYDDGCRDAVFTPLDFSIGPIEFVTAPVPATASSWGRVKGAYR
jgi:hypothetical protein